jgi:hypothetical protein
MTAASVSRLEFFQHEWMERENGYRAELELLQSTVQRFEDDLRASRGAYSLFSSFNAY